MMLTIKNWPSLSVNEKEQCLSEDTVMDRSVVLITAKIMESRFS